MGDQPPGNGAFWVPSSSTTRPGAAPLLPQSLVAGGPRDPSGTRHRPVHQPKSTLSAKPPVGQAPTCVGISRCDHYLGVAIVRLDTALDCRPRQAHLLAREPVVRRVRSLPACREVTSLRRSSATVRVSSPSECWMPVTDVEHKAPTAFGCVGTLCPRSRVTSASRL